MKNKRFPFGMALGPIFFYTKKLNISHRESFMTVWQMLPITFLTGRL